MDKTSRFLWFALGCLAVLLTAAGCGELDEPEEQHTYTDDEALWDLIKDEPHEHEHDEELRVVGSGLTGTGTGFYYPVDGSISGNANWSYCGSSYYTNVRHIGADLIRPIGTNVYAVTAGTVIARSGPAASSGWGSGLYALAVRHESSAGSFVAVYGHINTSLGINSVVSAGQIIGTVGDYDVSSDHLHFGIRPGTTIPSSGWGRISDAGCTNASATNGFVAPLSYIRNNTPLDTTRPTVSMSAPSSGATVSAGSSLTVSWTASHPRATLNGYSIELVSSSHSQCIGASALRVLASSSTTYRTSKTVTLPADLSGAYNLKVAVKASNGQWGCAMRRINLSTATASRPPTPTGVSASDGTYTDRIRVTYNPVAGATRYYLYRATSSSGSYTSLGYCTSTTCSDRTAAANTYYYYKVRAYNSAGYSNYSSYNRGYR